MKVPYDEGVAIHIDPESCGRRREAACEALTGARIGQPLSGVRLHNRSADALQSAEGNIVRRAMQATFGLRVVVRPCANRYQPRRRPGQRPRCGALHGVTGLCRRGSDGLGWSDYLDKTG